MVVAIDYHDASRVQNTIEFVIRRKVVGKTTYQRVLAAIIRER